MFGSKKKIGKLEKEIEELNQKLETYTLLVADLMNAALTRANQQDSDINTIVKTLAENEQVSNAKYMTMARKSIITEKILKDNDLDKGLFERYLN